MSTRRFSTATEEQLFTGFIVATFEYGLDLINVIDFRTVAGNGRCQLHTGWLCSLRSKQLDNLDPYEVRFVISKALEVWSKHSRLTFTEVESDRADILIYFYRREHGDHFPFDGRGIVLAHAFFPTGMATSVEVHFDADENWTTTGNSEDGTNMFNVAAHEIGHSLGLSHSNVEDALMYPWYKEMEDGFNYELPDDDKHAIQYLYGARDTTRNWDVIPKYPRIHTTITTTTTTTTTTAKPTERIHHTRAPKRPYDPRYPYGRNPYNNPYQPEKQPYYPNKPSHPIDKKPKNYPKQNPYSPERKYPYHKHTTEKNPKRSHPERERPTDRVSPVNPDKYPKRKPERSHPARSNPTKEYPSRKPPPDTCDTSYDAVAVIRREVFIFKDAYFWRIGDDGLLPGYPAEIRRLWHGLPEDLIHIDAVYERSDAKIVFFVGKKFYVFVDNKVEWGYPKPLTELGLPSSLKKIDAAMIWGHNGHTYFYSGSKYWKFDEKLGKVELDYPRNISTWKGVGTNIDAVFQWKDGKTYFFKGKGFWKFNDDLMKVVHVEQRLSAPFWMGCSTIYENDLGEKLPYRDMVIPPSSGTERIGGSFLFVSSMLVFSLSALRLKS